ncbi:MAG TPA: RNA polymerase sigma factor [Prolixibacteraceae bacterium]|nr:RNA polymerase sigma factor [Prolixibacteraceae bacterium]
MKSRQIKTLSDEEIISKFIEENSSKYFEILYNRYYSKVLDKCYSIVKNRQLSEELAEDIFSKTFEKLSSFKNLSSFSSWLYSLSYNHCIDYLRLKKKLHYPEWNREHELPEIIDESEEDMNNIDYDNMLVVFEMIHTEEKALLLMKYQDNLSIKEIAQSLRISEDATKMRLKRARARVVYLYKEKFWNK